MHRPVPNFACEYSDDLTSRSSTAQHINQHNKPNRGLCTKNGETIRHEGLDDSCDYARATGHLPRRALRRLDTPRRLLAHGLQGNQDADPP